MNDSEDPNRRDQSAEPLDEIILRLRDQSVPPVPSGLLDTELVRVNSGPEPKSRRSALIALVVLAATLLFALALPISRMGPVVGDKPVSQDVSPVSVVPVVRLDPYQDVEDELNQMQSEIAELKRRAELLDVYRKTESLLARN